MTGAMTCLTATSLKRLCNVYTNKEGARIIEEDKEEDGVGGRQGAGATAIGGGWRKTSADDL